MISTVEVYISRGGGREKTCLVCDSKRIAITFLWQMVLIEHIREVTSINVLRVLGEIIRM